MSDQQPETKELERELLRHAVSALAVCRQPCCDCGRTPLVGELVYAYEQAPVVCELCGALRRDRPRASTMVRSSELGHTVRVLRAA